MNEATLGLMVVAVVTVVFLLWFYNLQGQFGKLKDTKACELSVIEASKAGTGNFIELQCSTRAITIKSDGVYQSSLRGSGVRKPVQEKYLSYDQVVRRLERSRAGQPTVGAAISGTTGKPTKQEVLNEMGLYALATEMATCWRQFGEGSAAIDPFKSNVLMSENRCITCATITFDESYLRELGQNELKDFTKYLSDNTIDAKGTTFYNYVRPKEYQLNTAGQAALGTSVVAVPWLLLLVSTPTETKVQTSDTIQLNQEYVITYSYLDAAWFASWGLSKTDATVYLWPIDYRPSCDVLY
mgnify:FL=1